MLLSRLERSVSSLRCFSCPDNADSLGLGAGQTTVSCLAMVVVSRLVKWLLHARVLIVSIAHILTLSTRADTFSQTFRPAWPTLSSPPSLRYGEAGAGLIRRISTRPDSCSTMAR